VDCDIGRPSHEEDQNASDKSARGQKGFQPVIAPSNRDRRQRNNEESEPSEEKSNLRQRWEHRGVWKVGRHQQHTHDRV